jgi:hypothetical protein
MSYYDNNASWNNPPRPGWENRASTTHLVSMPGSVPANLPPVQMNQMKPEDPTAFSSQLDGMLAPHQTVMLP